MVKIDRPQILNDTQGATIMAWIRYSWDDYPDDEETRLEVMEKFGSFWINIRRDSNRVRVGFRSGETCEMAGSQGAAVERRDTVDTLEPGVWTHVAATFDRAQQALRIYIDGEEAALERITPLCTPNPDEHPLVIGARDADNSACPVCPDAFFFGTIDEVLIFSEALSAERIDQLVACRTTED